MSTYSIYIPSIHRDFPQEELEGIFGFWGVIDRIDYVEMNEPKANWIRAFIHFQHINTENIIVMGNVKYLEEGNKITRGYYMKNPNYFHSIPFDRIKHKMKEYNEYCMDIYKNYAPVQKTTLNIHQLANNFDILKETTEFTFSEQQTKIEELNQRVAQQDDIINRLKEELSSMRSSFFKQ